MPDDKDLSRRALHHIDRCSDPLELERMMKNAAAKGNREVARAAERKLYAVRPSAEPGTLEHSVWQSIFALEGSLKVERGKTTLLARTRQKIARDGEAATVADLVKKPASEGYRMLLDRGMPGLTLEAVALRHRDRFDEDVLRNAEQRLVQSGVYLRSL